MLPKTQRLTKKEFSSVFKNGARLHGSTFTAHSLAAPKTQVAVSVPSKTAKHAVDRNRIRRQTYRAINIIIDNISPQKLVIVIRQESNPKLFLEELRKFFVKK